MSRKKRYYRSAIVVTVAVSAATSCGGTTNDDSAATGGQATGGNGMHTGGQSTGGSSGGQSTGGHTGATDSGGNEATGGSNDVRRCVDDELYLGAACDAGDECLVDMDCTSGVSKAIYLRCAGASGWVVDDAECENPEEECQASSGTARCDGEEWHFDGVGGNPPAPCPLEQPEEGSSCRYGFGFGADPDACGYPCDDDGWTIVGCQTENPDEPEPGEGSWQSDGECSLGGAGGGAP